MGCGNSKTSRLVVNDHQEASSATVANVNDKQKEEEVRKEFSEEQQKKQEGDSNVGEIRESKENELNNKLDQTQNENNIPNEDDNKQITKEEVEDLENAIKDDEQVKEEKEITEKEDQQEEHKEIPLEKTNLYLIFGPRGSGLKSIMNRAFEKIQMNQEKRDGFVFLQRVYNNTDKTTGEETDKFCKYLSQEKFEEKLLKGKLTLLCEPQAGDSSLPTYAFRSKLLNKAKEEGKTVIMNIGEPYHAERIAEEIKTTFNIQLVEVTVEPEVLRERLKEKGYEEMFIDKCVLRTKNYLTPMGLEISSKIDNSQSLEQSVDSLLVALNYSIDMNELLDKE
ncbi:hypothetical protein ABK040_012499 [Willaertia magna]